MIGKDCGWNVAQKNLRLPLISSIFDVKAQWTKCMTSWCAYIPLTGKQEITVIFSPLETSSTKEVILKVDLRLSLCKLLSDSDGSIF